MVVMGLGMGIGMGIFARPNMVFCLFQNIEIIEIIVFISISGPRFKLTLLK